MSKKITELTAFPVPASTDLLAVVDLAAIETKKTTVSQLAGVLDHGALLGLADDDHTIYSLADGLRDFSGVVVGVDPTASNHLATKEYVDSAIAFIENYFLIDTASDIAGIYYVASETVGGGGGTLPTLGLGTGDGQALVNFATLSTLPGVNTLLMGVYELHAHVQRTNGTKPYTVYFELYTRTDPGGVETLRATSEDSAEYDDNNENVIEIHANVAADVDINTTDRLVWKLLVDVGSAGSAIDLDILVEGTTNAHVAVPTTTEVLSSVFVRQDGTKELSADWDAGSQLLPKY
ncbi:hypothetical protein LCGC14_1402030 [marine sediment metagenome]|uniref:Uncharacterized protein n=1 Tax=marine sediment metagenome TaxID=412755 RepID=A0A0F9MCE2_9ZZZZ